MYEKFYGLKEKPFRIIPNPNYFYLSSKHKNALTYLEYGLVEEIGFILLTGDIGTGKTTLIRYLLNKIDTEIDFAVIFNTKVSPDEFLSLILIEFDLDAYTSVPKAEKIDIFFRFLIEKYANNRRVLLIIDEAQNLPNDTLEEIRMLSNLQTDNRLLLQIMLVGQPQLRHRLSEPDLDQFSQRIAVNYHLTAITNDETSKYVAYRLEKAGGSPEIFSDDALNLIYRSSSGIPRIINLLCETALVYGFAEQVESINASIINKVIEDKIAISPQPGSNNRDSQAIKPHQGQNNKYIKNQVNQLESKIHALESKFEKMSLDISKSFDRDDNELLKTLKYLILSERKRNTQLIGEYSRLKFKYDILRKDKSRN